MKIPLDVSLDKKDFDIFLDRYHFSKGDIDDVKSLYKAINPLIAAEAFFWLWPVGATLCCAVWVSHCRDFSCC